MRARAAVAALGEVNSSDAVNLEEPAPSAAGKNLRGDTMSPEQAAMLEQARAKTQADAWLCPLGQGRGHTVLDMPEEQYLALLDWTGRCIAADKAGSIPEDLRPLLLSMDLEVEQWLTTVRRYGGLFHRVAGKWSTLKRKAEEFHQQWLAGVRASRVVFRTPVRV
jgi:hypothetical protein